MQYKAHLSPASARHGRSDWPGLGTGAEHSNISSVYLATALSVLPILQHHITSHS
jgi:hypothetical protein